MKYLDIMNNFENYLKRKPELMPSSVRTYAKMIRELVNKYGADPSLDYLNLFIEEKCKKRQPVVKYALRHYLKFRWRADVYNKLVKATVRPLIKKKTYLKRHEALDIIDRIERPEHKLIAKIQYFTGTRASEVISIKSDNVLHEYEAYRIRIDIVSKGGKIEPIYLDDSIWIEMQPYVLLDREHLFLKDASGLSETKFWLKVENYYKMYYQSIRDAAAELNLKIGTHDWRRSFTQSIRDQGADIIEVQKALRHVKIETTERYFKDEPEKVAKTMLKHQKGINPSSNY